MSQIDKVVYLPILFWFWLFFITLYFFLFSNFITYIYTAFKVRQYYLNDLITFCYNTFYLTNLYLFFCFDFANKNFFKIIKSYLQTNWLFSLTISLKNKYIKI